MPYFAPSVPSFAQEFSCRYLTRVLVECWRHCRHRSKSPFARASCGASSGAVLASRAPDKSVLIGSFEISELPDNDATLFLLIQAHDALSTGVKFQSHVYSNSPDAQVALFDSYVGAKVGTKNLLTISDLQNQKDAGCLRGRARGSNIAGKRGVECRGFVGTGADKKRSLVCAKYLHVAEAEGPLRVDPAQFVLYSMGWLGSAEMCLKG